MEFREHRLENGLEVVAECNPRAYSTSIAFFVNAGSRDEDDETSGVSHFLEHMVFKGTPNRSPADVNRELDEIGSKSNAYTSEERTVYYCSILPEFQGRAVELLSDIMRPSLREEDFEKEQKVIIEEIQMYEDQPPYGAYDKCMSEYFGSHPLSRSILGTTESVGNLTPERMRKYFETRYSPSNIALVASGNVDFDRLVDAAHEHCGHWQAFDARRETPRAQPGTGFKVVKKEAATQQYVVQISDGPAAEDEDRFAGRIAAQVFGDYTGSRLFWEFVDKGLAEYAAVEVHECEGTGVLISYFCCDPKDTSRNLNKMLELQREIEKNGVTETEVEQVKNKIVSSVVLASELPSRRLGAVGVNWLQLRKYRPVEEVISTYKSLTHDDVTAIFQKYPLSQNTTFAIGPLAKLNPPK